MLAAVHNLESKNGIACEFGTFEGKWPIAATPRGGSPCGRGQVAYRRLVTWLATLLESSVTRPYDAPIVYNFWPVFCRDTEVQATLI